eukprot:TRINITY_DN11884_c0_g1_i2.p2 TRINITY_DN11884_c0_g1~~TRINITY_DN11884_c0_g1_i2.p2  ORF type:complete len:223 (-),score=105.87 TRINITY_DN11884_c0_g1_i2:20-688(-)
MDLKVQLLQEKEKLKAKAQGISSMPKKKEDSNKGVELRNLKDLQDTSQGNLQQNLESKAQVYEQLLNDKKSHKKGKKFLVDFEQKRWDMEEKYEEACKEYRGEKCETGEDKVGMKLKKDGEMARQLKHQEEERLKWEEGVKSGKIKETEEIVVRKVPLVKQSYDHVLSKEEKAHLPEIEEERRKQKKLQEMIRKRREEELSLIHICRCRRYAVCRSRWSPYH